VFSAYITVRSGIGLGILVGVAIWAAVWPMFAIGMKRRWGFRPEIEDAAAPTFRRPWSQASDRWLSTFKWLSAFGAVVLAVGVVDGMDRTILGGFIPFLLDILFVLTIRNERRHRANTH
jgi:hypothetical protein